MCRNIRQLHNFEPPATHDEIHASALQYVRKISGSTKPSQANQEAFDRAIEEVVAATTRLLDHARHQRPAEEPRGRGHEGQGPRGAALRGLRRGRAARDARARGATRGARRARAARAARADGAADGRDGAALRGRR